jgi:hypothetical protein
MANELQIPPKRIKRGRKSLIDWDAMNVGDELKVQSIEPSKSIFVAASVNGARLNRKFVCRRLTPTVVWVGRKS